jgi:hypothetical protein
MTLVRYGSPGGWQANENLAAMVCILCITARISPGFAALLTFLFAAGFYFDWRE